MKTAVLKLFQEGLLLLITDLSACLVDATIIVSSLFTQILMQEAGK